MTDERRTLIRKAREEFGMPELLIGALLAELLPTGNGPDRYARSEVEFWLARWANQLTSDEQSQILDMLERTADMQRGGFRP